VIIGKKTVAQSLALTIAQTVIVTFALTLVITLVLKVALTVKKNCRPYSSYNFNKNNSTKFLP